MKWIPINNLALTGPEAVKKFLNVKGQGFHEDSSCLAMLRAIVWPRMRPTDFLRFKPLYYSKDCTITPEGLKAAQAGISQLLSDVKRENHLLFLCLTGNMHHPSGGDLAARSRAWLNELAESIFQGFEHVPVVEEVAKRNNVTVVALIERGTRTTVFLCMQNAYDGYRLMECSLTKLLPWYFSEEYLDRGGYERKLIILLNENIVAFSKLLDKIGKRILRSDPPYDFSDLV